MPLSAILYCFLLILILSVVASCLWHEKRARISPTPTLPWVKRKALRLLSAHTNANEKHAIADLGCGWGGVLVSLAKQYPNAAITGFEISPWPFLVSRFRSLFRKRIAVLREDFFKADLRGYTILFCYLSPRHMEELKPRLETLAPGTLILSCSFAIPGWTPLAAETVDGPVKIPVFLYKIIPR